MPAELIKYTASAGSGKTFTLVKNYLSIALENPSAFMSILAVTFTNLAANEMKERILKDLETIKKDPGNSDLAKVLMEDKGWTSTEIASKAAGTLTSIVNNYSKFSITTIDSFFQRLVKALARYQGLEATYDIRLDTEEVVKETWQALIEDIGKGNKDLDALFLDKTMEKMREKGVWAIDQAEDYEFFKMLFQEEMQENWKVLEGWAGETGTKVFYDQVSKLADKKKGEFEDLQLEFKAVLKAFHNELRVQLSNADKKIKHIEKFLEVKSLHGFINFENNNGFNKLTSSSSNEDIAVAIFKKDSKADVVDYLNRNSSIANTIRLFDTKFEALLPDAILIDALKGSKEGFLFLLKFFEKLTYLKKKKKWFLLAEQNKLIKIAIEDLDAPVLLELVGSNYKHIFIDEFQDTSNNQWQPLLKLIVEGIATGNQSLIVGDIKQSIYAFRGGDWRVMSGVNSASIGVENTVKQETLSHNYRSRSNIIKANNAFFIQNAIEVLGQANDTDQITKKPEDERYNEIFEAFKRNYLEANVAQQIPTSTLAKQDGFVRHTFYQLPKGSTHTKVLEVLLPDLVADLRYKGFKASDITILVHTSNHAGLCKQTLNKAKYAMVTDDNGIQTLKYKDPSIFDARSSSDDQFGSQDAIRFLDAALCAINTPEKKVNFLIFKAYFLYQRLTITDFNKQNAYNIVNSGVFEEEISSDLVASIDDKVFIDFGLKIIEITKKVSTYTVYELVMELVKTFGLNKDRKYALVISQFADAVKDYQDTKRANLAAWLAYYKDKGYKTAITGSASKDVINIVTIHKSKGLEYPIVVIPYPSSEISATVKNDWKKSKTLFLTAEDQSAFTDTFPEISYPPVIPIKTRKLLRKTSLLKIIERQEIQEKFESTNVQYVAFTRAKLALFTFGSLPKESEKSAKKGDEIKFQNNRTFINHRTLQNLVKQGNTDFIETTVNIENIASVLTFTVGAFDKLCPEEEKQTDTNFEMADTWQMSDWHKLPLGFFSKNLNFLDDDNENDDSTEIVTTSAMLKGIALHQVLETITTIHDVDVACESAASDGLLDSSTITDMAQNIKNMFNLAPIKHCFDGSCTVLHEARMGRLVDGVITEKRADRVVIDTLGNITILDYKTGSPTEKHIQQVQLYMSWFQDMGLYNQINGFILYTNAKTENQIQQVMLPNNNTIIV